MASGGLTSQPLNPTSGFNWVFLVELLVCGVLTVFFLFYFNRLFATLISYGVRAYTWHTYHAYIDIQALQVSLLAGRVFFKDIRYHGHNQTILIHGGYITWQYWLRKVKEPELFNSTTRAENGAAKEDPDKKRRGRSSSLGKEEKGGIDNSKSLPCRISIKVFGMEAFIYNRSPAYDGIVDNILGKSAGKEDPQNTPEKGGINTNRLSEPTSMHSEKDMNSNPIMPPRTSSSSSSSFSSGINGSAQESTSRLPDPPTFLRIFPVNIECSKGAIVIGNEHTTSVITAQFDKASGSIDVGHAGPLDLYRQLFSFKVSHPVVHMRHNPDFKALTLASAAHLRSDAKQRDLNDNSEQRLFTKLQQRWWKLSLPSFLQRSLDSINSHSRSSSIAGPDKADPLVRQPPLPGQGRWQGLGRYLEENQNDEHDEWDSVEYAKVSLIADCPAVTLRLYWDVAGPVPYETEDGVEPALSTQDINGSPPPKYGADIEVHGGTINYGPWADRQRANMQSFFFPASYADAVPAQPVRPGETRVLSKFELFVSIEQDTILRIPMREPSKDWKWKGRADTVTGKANDQSVKEKPKTKTKRRRAKQREKVPQGSNVRPFAWIDIKIATNTSISYAMDMVASTHGYSNRLLLDVISTEVSSSVNHGLLWRSGPISIDCDLSNPTRWNGLRKWGFNISGTDLDLFLLRDHLFLFIDLISDWGSGPPSEYFTFTPFQYFLNVDFRGLKLYLNTNDGNIVNNPSDFEDNRFILLSAEELYAKLTIPLDRFRPPKNEIPFDINGNNLALDFCMPPRNTLHSFLREKRIAELGNFTMTGSHNYCANTSPSLTDTLRMDIHGAKLSLIFYGFLFHYVMKLKDNYFGEDMHFKTLEEYQGLPRQSLAVDNTMDPKEQPVKKDNDLDVIMCIAVEEAEVLLPSGLYSAEDGIKIDTPSALIDLRFTNYYMDVMLNLAPLSLALGKSAPKDNILIDSIGSTELFIDSVAIYGHRLFGLPPLEPTYVCHWDLDVGRVSGQCSIEFMTKLSTAGQSLVFTLDDDENSVPLTEPPIIHDVTYLRLQTGVIHVWLQVAEQAILFSTGNITVDFNDLADETFSQRLQLTIPDIIVACVDAKATWRRRSREEERHIVKTYAFLETSVAVSMLARKYSFRNERQKQQDHIRGEDRRTHRTPFLLLVADNSVYSRLSRPPSDVHPPAMPYPPMPQPLLPLMKTPTISMASTTSSTGNPHNLSQSHPRFSAAKRSLRSVSSSSLIGSIRQAHHGKTGSVKSTGVDHEHPIGTINATSRRERGGLAPLSAAFSSPFAAPYSPFGCPELDLTDVPQISILDHLPTEDPQAVDDVFQRELDDSYAQRSFIISLDKGIKILCTPQALYTVGSILESIQPTKPEMILDSFQRSVIQKTLDLQKQQNGHSIANEINLRIPSIKLRFLNDTDWYSDEAGADRDEIDQFDIGLQGLVLTTRIRENFEQIENTNKLVLHLLLNSLEFSAKAKPSHISSTVDAAIRAELDELLVWAVNGPKISVGASFRRFEAFTVSRQIKYLSSLTKRTEILIDRLKTRFGSIGSTEDQRLRYLAWRLTTIGRHIPDPAFLTRPSYALRTGNDHLRTHDSWKVISRFRQMYEALSYQDKSKLEEECIHEFLSYSTDAKEYVLSHWKQWRNWDITSITSSLAMLKLYGPDKEQPKIPKKPMPIQFEARCALIRAVVDRGPSQSDVTIRLLTITTSSSPPSGPSGLMLLQNGSPPRLSIVQISSSSITIGISWEIHEFVDNLMKTVDQINMKTNKPEMEPTTLDHNPISPNSSESHEFQVAFVNEEFKIRLDSINLRILTEAQGLRLSLIGSDKVLKEKKPTLSTMVCADAASLEIQSRSRLVLQSRVDRPSLTICKQSDHSSNKHTEEWKISGSTNVASVRVKEDLLGIIEVVDAVLSDEITYLQRHFNSGKVSAPPISASKHSPSLPNITLALVMDSYRVDISILPALLWIISGDTGRISASPSFGRHKRLNVNFDLGIVSHSLQSVTTDQHHHMIALLNLPRINGTLGLQQTDKNTSVKVNSTIEMIVVEASAIHALLVVAQRPELSSLFRTAKDDITTLKAHVDEIFPAQDLEPVPDLPVEQPVIYEVSLALAGLRIHASAPGHTPSSSSANLLFGLSYARVTATNRSEYGFILPMPRLSAQIQQIRGEMALVLGSARQKCGDFTFSVSFFCDIEERMNREPRRTYRAISSGLEINVYAETASAVVDVVNHLQDRMKDLDLSREKKYLRKLRAPRRSSIRPSKNVTDEHMDDDLFASSGLFTSRYSLELLNIQVSWIVGNSIPAYPGYENEDLVLSFRKIDLSTRKEDTARLMIEGMQLQMTPSSADKKQRSLNSALLPEVVFSVAYNSTIDDRRFSLKAMGKSLDICLESSFILPANVLQRSITLAGKKVQIATASWMKTPTSSGAQRKSPFGNKRLSSLLIDADFAGAVVHLQGSKKIFLENSRPSRTKDNRVPSQGRYGQFSPEDTATNTSLKAPGVALKVEYKDDGRDPSLNAELKIDGSANTLYPAVVPLIMEISKTIQEVVKDKDEAKPVTTPLITKPNQKTSEEDNFITVDPNTLLGRTRLNLGIRICKQEFSLSCQPIARVSATARFEDIYMTINSVKSIEHGNFFAISAAFEKLQASVQHVYSRESTFSFNMDSVVLSLMNSKHVSGTSGISAILKIDPTRTQINARQLQDFLLFREIWIPPEVRQPTKPPSPSTEPQEYLVQRYQQVTAAAAFPWNATVAIAELSVELDLGQALGKPSLKITELWASSKKNSSREQNLCIGMRSVAIESAGRMDIFMELSGFKVRTSICWPPASTGQHLTPSIQASIGLRSLRFKAGFDYQAFMVADIESFEFLMYNAREKPDLARDRLIAILDGGKVHVFCTTTSVAQGLALFQALERLVQENKAAYAQSLREIERFLQRKSMSTAVRIPSEGLITARAELDSPIKAPISLHTDVVVSLNSIYIGAFPTAFTDNQVLNLEGSNVQARFAVALQGEKIHSELSMTLGQLSVALASVSSQSRAASSITIEDVVHAGISSRGGTILRVPRVVATMQTWQLPESNKISYIFKSSLEGKVDVGWNYSRIAFIRNMWTNHSRTLASRLGKPLPESAVKITTTAAAASTTGTEKLSGTSGESASKPTGGEKITAVVNVPQSKYEYEPLEPPIIETPQLRDMGEATPPLEWIGLHRDRLPNVTHQIVIVTLLEIAKEVEDAYERILGSS